VNLEGTGGAKGSALNEICSQMRRAESKQIEYEKEKDEEEENDSDY
jgi:hypothetical protein